MSEAKLDEIRRTALNQIDKSRKKAIGFMIVAGLVEAVLFLAVIFVMEFDNQTHKVIFLASCLVYCPLLLGLLSLRAYIDLTGQRILAAIQNATTRESPDDEPKA